MVTDNAGNRIPATKQSFIADTQGKYIPIHLAGTGKSGQVWYALRKTTALVHKANPSTLVAQLCAVKIFPAAARQTFFTSDTSIHPNDNTPEVATMSTISRLARGNMAHRFPQFLDALSASQLPHTVSPWIAMRAVRGFELQDMVYFSGKLRCPLPEALVYQCFVQLSEGLEFLHTNGLSKPDIQVLNIMVDVAAENAEVRGVRLPNFVWIDFGGCEVGERMNAWRRGLERSSFYECVFKLATQRHICKDRVKDASQLQTDICGKHSAQWVGFVEALRRYQRVNFDKDLHDVELRRCGTYFDMAKTKRGEIGAFDQKVIDAFLDNTLAYSPMRRKFPSEEDVVAAIKEFEELSS